MYIQASEGLGQYTIKRNGHEHVKWSKCGKLGTRQRVCGITLNVKFRHSFGDFRKEVERAFRRWMTGSRARMLIEKREGDLKTFHKARLDLKVPDKAPVEVAGIFTYRGPDGGKWRIVDIRFEWAL